MRWPWQGRVRPPSYGAIVAGLAGAQAMVLAMRQKDPDLFNRVSNMTPARAAEVWRETYPEDFTLGANSQASPSSIVPRGQYQNIS